jgi:hypothetical protein
MRFCVTKKKSLIKREALNLQDPQMLTKRMIKILMVKRRIRNRFTIRLKLGTKVGWVGWGAAMLLRTVAISLIICRVDGAIGVGLGERLVGRVVGRSVICRGRIWRNWRKARLMSGIQGWIKFMGRTVIAEGLGLAGN